MALYIRDDTVRDLAAKLARRQGLTVTETVRAALLEAERRLKGEDFARTDVTGFA